MLGERVGQRDAVGVAPLAQLVLVGHRAGGGAGAEQRAAEARALLVGPVDEPHGDRRLALLGQPSQHLDAAHDVEAAVEPAAVRHGVDVAADEQRALGGAAQREPLVAGLVDLLLDRHGGELPAQPLARPLPRLRPGDALGAVLVSGQLLELAQLLDGAGRLERHARSLIADDGDRLDLDLELRQRERGHLDDRVGRVRLARTTCRAGRRSSGSWPCP